MIYRLFFLPAEGDVRCNRSTESCSAGNEARLERKKSKSSLRKQTFFSKENESANATKAFQLLHLSKQLILVLWFNFV